MKYIIRNIADFLDIKFPVLKGEEWDHNGLVMGSIKSEFTSVLIALDLTSKVINEAISKNISLIITHHPFLFEETLSLEFKINPYKKKIFRKLQNTGIAYYSLHTSFDIAPKGMPLAITTALGLIKKEYSIIKKYGILIKSDKIQNIGDLTKLLKTSFNINSVDFYGDDYRAAIKKVAILPGAGSLEDIQAIKKTDADILVTSDIKWSTLLNINELKIPLISISHYMENVFVEFVANIIKNKFKNIYVTTFDIKINSQNI